MALYCTITVGLKQIANGDFAHGDPEVGGSFHTIPNQVSTSYLLTPRRATTAV